MCLHISSCVALRSLAALAARPFFCTSSRILVNSTRHGGPPPGPPPGPPNGDTGGAMAWGGAPMGDMVPGIDMGPGAAGAPDRGGSVAHGSVCALAWHAGTTANAKMRERRLALMMCMDLPLDMCRKYCGRFGIHLVISPWIPAIRRQAWALKAGSPDPNRVIP